MPRQQLRLDSPAVVPTAPEQPTPTPSPLADTTEVKPLRSHPRSSNRSTHPLSPPIPTVPKDEAPRIAADDSTQRLARSREPKLPRPRTKHAGLSWTPSRVPPTFLPWPTIADPLCIGKLCLCRKILGFGSFEPLHEPRVKAGQRILLYCEMTGMQYEAKEASFVSRLSSKIEIGSVDNGAFQWAHELGPAEDVCGSRRHDFFVNYRFYLPETLPPGSYRLRLTQTDLVANRSTSAEIPLEIVP